jgi:hypothetical protein
MIMEMSSSIQGLNPKECSLNNAWPHVIIPKMIMGTGKKINMVMVIKR